MRASIGGRNELAARVQQALEVPTKKQADQIVEAVIRSLEASLEAVHHWHRYVQ